MLLLTVALGCVVLYLLYALFNIRPNNFPPGPPCLPIIGSFPFVPSTYLHFHMEKWAKRYGPVVGLMLGKQPVIIVCKPKQVLEVLQRDEFQARPENANFRLDTFNRKLGVFFSDGAFWVEQRRFTLRHLRDFGFGKSKMESLICDEIEDVVRELRDCHEFQVSRYFGLSSVNVIWALLAGSRFSRDDARLQALLDSLMRLFRSGSQTGSIVNVIPVLKLIAPRITGHSEQVEHITKLQTFFRGVIQEHRETYSENNLRDFIDVYLQEMKAQSNNQHSTFSEEGLIVTCFDLFGAGAESISNLLSFSLLYSILYPQVQHKVQHLLDSVVGRDRRPCLQDRPRLQYVEAVLAEVMRLNTVAPVAPAHRVTEDTTLAGYNIPKDTTMIASLWCLLSNEEHWGDPQNFRPERFLDDEGNFVKDDWMISFGTGRRTCLGEVMARNLLFLFYTTLLQQFTFTIPHGHKKPATLCLPGITTAPQPFRATVTPRFLP
ncbi:hypothetical protein L9F63_005730 [Diploptera punctata]|uniref:Uncharacterized protein n=1 Tax=Diploptera punctata TaxID=6984 RepID=A0AAD8E5W9_DIPPU|nr:hypothetical protein L9F63_005730 [Diploptera punctata]